MNFLRKLVTAETIVGCGPRFYLPLVSSAKNQSTLSSFNTLKLTTPSEFVVNVEINRPEKRNAMTFEFWTEIRDCFQNLSTDSNCRAIILSGAGKIFSAGIDFSDLGDMTSILQTSEDLVRKGNDFYKRIRYYQESFTTIEKCPKPVIAAVHGACVGAGVDLISVCDIRYCTQDAYFQVKEVDIGLAADLGTLQKLPKIIGNDSIAREMVYSSMKVDAAKAEQVGIVSRISFDKETMMKDVLETAKNIASKSPVAVQGSKINLNYSRDHSIDDGLEFNARWNMYALQSEDLMKAGMAAMTKSGPPDFSKL